MSDWMTKARRDDRRKARCLSGGSVRGGDGSDETYAGCGGVKGSVHRTALQTVQLEAAKEPAVDTEEWCGRHRSPGPLDRLFESRSEV